MNTVQYVSFACYDRDRYKFIIFDIWISLKYRTDYTNSAHIMILQSAVYYVHSYISYYGRTRVLGICTCIHNYRRSNNTRFLWIRSNGFDKSPLSIASISKFLANIISSLIASGATVR